ncbi:MAG: DUF4097 family beta strand repeat protein [Clostridia bacterium]|nr:DUF4097 family beta strand repeat protein [Clostridia bacterium]
MKEKLKQYIESAFSKAAKTQRNDELKEEVLSNLYEKYDDFLASGLSEEEAFRQTVNNIGDLSELFEASESKKEKETVANDAPPTIDEPLVPLYDETTVGKKKIFFGVGLSIAIILYVFSLFPVILFENNIAAAIMLWICAAATGILLYTVTSKPTQVSSALTEEEKQSIRKKKTISSVLLSVSVSLYVLSVSPVILFDNKFGVLAMFVLVAAATALIVLRATAFRLSHILHPDTSSGSPKEHAGTEKSKEPTYKKVLKIIFGIFSVVYWILVCAIYIGASILTFRWEITWLIFPLAIPLHMIVAAIFDLFLGKHRVGAIIRLVIAPFLLVIFLIIGSSISGNDLFFGSFSFLLYTDDSYKIGDVSLEDEQINTVNIEWVDGTVKILYWDEDYVRISESASELIKEKDQMRYRVSGDTLNVIYYAPGVFRFGVDPTKTLVVQLPRNTELNLLNISGVNAKLNVTDLTAVQARLSTVSGNVELNNCHFQDLDVESISGTVTLSGTVGSVSMESVSGSLHLSLNTVPDEINLEGISANLRLALPQTPEGFSIEKDSLSGKIDLPAEVRIEDDEYVFGEGKADIGFESLSGDLIIAFH